MAETKKFIKRIRKDHAESETEWQLCANRLKNDKADAMREMDRNRREELVELARLRTEAAERAAELDGALTREREASRRVRDMPFKSLSRCAAQRPGSLLVAIALSAGHLR